MGRREDGPLTEQEKQVLRLISLGKKSQDTADTLYISKRTVDWHTASIYRKLGVKNRVQALIRARDLGLL